tara:strand:+ start:85791 stop:86249 length:459 start_codon:yes stop_codon:yes gene_type:complete
MKRPYYQIIVATFVLFFITTIVDVGCGNNEVEHVEELLKTEKPDSNKDSRQEHMRELAKLYEVIAGAVDNGSLKTIKGDARSLKEIMKEVATIPPKYDATRYGFYASDFQVRVEDLATAAEQGSAVATKSALENLAITCGVCHYNCQLPNKI